MNNVSVFTNGKEFIVAPVNHNGEPIEINGSLGGRNLSDYEKYPINFHRGEIGVITPNLSVREDHDGGTVTVECDVDVEVG